MRRNGSVVAAVLVALALAACGGSSAPNTPGSAQIIQTLKTYLTAVVNGDGTKACGLMTAHEQQVLASDASSNLGAGQASCADLIKAAAKDLTSTDRTALEHLTVTKVQVNGDTATLTLKGLSRKATMTKTDGHWLVSADVG